MSKKASGCETVGCLGALAVVVIFFYPPALWIGLGLLVLGVFIWSLVGYFSGDRDAPAEYREREEPTLYVRAEVREAAPRPAKKPKAPKPLPPPVPAVPPPSQDEVRDEDMAKLLVVDVETTGLGRDAELIEISMALLQVHVPSGTIVQELRRHVGLQEPAGPIPAAATRVHGITIDEVRGKALDLKTIDAMFVECTFVLAHNAKFDKRFVSEVVPIMRRRPWLCSCWNVDWPSRGFQNSKLQDLAAAHGIQIARAHRADSDVDSVIGLMSKTDPTTGRPYLWTVFEHHGIVSKKPRPARGRKPKARG